MKHFLGNPILFLALVFILVTVFLSERVMAESANDPCSGITCTTLVGAWYFDGWNPGLKVGVRTAPNSQCGYHVDNWDFVRGAAKRPVDILYTSNANERNTLLGEAFEDGGVAAYLPINQVTGVIPLYRFWNGSVHYFATKESERQEALSKGFQEEGITGYVFPTYTQGGTVPYVQGTMPLYRLVYYDTVYELTTDGYKVWDTYTKGFMAIPSGGSTPTQADYDAITVGYVYTEETGRNRGDTVAFYKLVKPLAGQTPLPRNPLLGYVSDAEQPVMDQYIDWAADNGIDFFAFDWYYAPYSGCPQIIYQDEALKTFMGSTKAYRMKFSAAWFPAYEGDGSGLGSGYYNYTEQTFKDGLDYILTNYATHPSYLKINGNAAVFLSEYQTMWLLNNDRAAFMRIITYAKQHGLYVIAIGPPEASYMALGFDAVTDYGYIFQMQIDGVLKQAEGTKQGSVVRYADIINRYKTVYWPMYSQQAQSANSSLNFIPTATGGWDRSGIPWINYRSEVMTYNTPQLWDQHLRDIKAFVEQNPNSNPKIVMLHAWNEWSEGTVIEPDEYWGTQYVEKIKTVFGIRTPACTDDCTLGQKRCYNSYVQSCGNYDADSCLEWNSGIYCQYGCSGEQCNPNPCVQGDLNCDGNVDILDLSFITSHFGQTVSHPQWNATADVVADNEIDIYDVVFVAGRFG